MKRYNPKEIEPKWQKLWADSHLYATTEDASKPKRYVLEYFPYPSGSAMHVGHVRNYTIGDVLSRVRRMQGYNVLHPMGWDAFGLPAENYAIKTGVSPQEAVAGNVKNFKQQLMQMGFSYDWSREINSTDPSYYRWTQWLFLLLFKRGLAYQKESLQWWCPFDKTVLANEQVEAGRCWRCGHEVEKKSLKQWFFKITDYADRLERDLQNLDWSEPIKAMQRNWIGRSVGAELVFRLEENGRAIDVFTTRPDTVFGATFVVLSPEHPLVETITADERLPQVTKYVTEALKKSEIERMEQNRPKTGVFTGAYATNPASGNKTPVWVADYVLPGYGTGAIMAVPAHDERDWQFAKQHDLPIIPVYDQDGADPSASYHGEGVIKNSESFDGLSTAEAREKIVGELAAKGLAKEKTNYKIHDWLISRQRYWGAPIPIIHCPADGPVPVPEEQLPVELPPLASYGPSGDGRSPLARSSEFLNVQCPRCGGPAERETDTMDGFACSSWYFLRFADPRNDQAAFARQKVDFWLPVDDYIGGAEHAVMHLLYARFWTKVLFDENLIGFDEPFTSLRNHGMVLAPDGAKMSKSKGNTIEPGELLSQGYGADAIRLMELFIGPWNQEVNWSVEGLAGMYRFLQRIWVLVDEYAAASTTERRTDAKNNLRRLTHQTIKRVSADLHELGFNTAVAALMEMVNELYKVKAKESFVPPQEWRKSLETLLLLLAPFAPHIAEELWQRLGHDQSIHLQTWPVWDENLTTEDSMTIVVQINGRRRAEIKIPAGSDEAVVIKTASEAVKTALKDHQVTRRIYVPRRLINFVTK